ncbi:MAG: hypothetical protein II187_12310 [Treponema sp.]|jgi:hypothetical protein|nr:hypothetical protein [Treponema sp.]
MKQHILRRALVLAAVCCAAPLNALDYGGSLTSSAEISGHINPYHDQVFKFGGIGWISSPLNKANTMDINAQLSVSEKLTTTFSQGIDETLDARWLKYLTPDIDLLKFNYRQPFWDGGTLAFSAGRFQYFDATAQVFAQNCDGMLLQLNTDNVRGSFYIGYTGLLNQKKVSMLDMDGKNYRVAGEEKEEWYEAYYSPADPYYVQAVSVTFPYLFLNQSLGFDFNMFIGTYSPFRTNINYNRYYATINMTGALVQNLYYTFSTTFQTEEFVGTGNMTQLSFTYYPEKLSSSVSLNALYASGNNNGPFSRFRGFTSNSISYSRYAPEMSGALKLGTYVTLKPLRELFLGVGTDFLFACPDDDITYDGWQMYANFKLQCTTDFQISITDFFYRGFRSRDPDNHGVVVKATMSF